MKNKAKQREYMKHYHQTHERKRPIQTKDDLRWKGLLWALHQFNLTLDEFAEIEEEQDWSCAICRQPQEGRTKRLAVDHDHRTGKVRGFLCERCNRGLGLFQDNLETLETACHYLEHSGIVRPDGNHFSMTRDGVR